MLFFVNLSLTLNDHSLKVRELRESFPPGKGVSSVKFSCLNLTRFPYNHYYICILFITLLFSFALHYRFRLPVQNAQKLFKTEKYQLNCLVERNYEKSHNWSSKNDKWKKISAFWSHNLKLIFIRMVILCAQSAFLMYLHNDFLSLRCWLSPIWFSHLFFFRRTIKWFWYVFNAWNNRRADKKGKSSQP